MASFLKQITVQELTPRRTAVDRPVRGDTRARRTTARARTRGWRAARKADGGGMSIVDIARPEIRSLAPYSSARMEAGERRRHAQRERIAVADSRHRRSIAIPIRSRRALLDALAQVFMTSNAEMRSRSAAAATRRSICSCALFAVRATMPSRLPADVRHVRRLRARAGRDVIEVPLTARFERRRRRIARCELSRRRCKTRLPLLAEQSDRQCDLNRRRSNASPTHSRDARSSSSTKPTSNFRTSPAQRHCSLRTTTSPCCARCRKRMR